MAKYALAVPAQPSIIAAAQAAASDDDDVASSPLPKNTNLNLSPAPPAGSPVGVPTPNTSRGAGHGTADLMPIDQNFVMKFSDQVVATQFAKNLKFSLRQHLQATINELHQKDVTLGHSHEDWKNTEGFGEKMWREKLLSTGCHKAIASLMPNYIVTNSDVNASKLMKTWTYNVALSANTMTTLHVPSMAKAMQCTMFKTFYKQVMATLSAKYGRKSPPSNRFYCTGQYKPRTTPSGGKKEPKTPVSCQSLADFDRVQQIVPKKKITAKVD